MNSKLVQLESDYPTNGVSGKKCMYDATKAKLKPMSQVFVKPEDVDQLIGAINENPVLAEVNADLEFVFYQGGIIDTDECTASIIQPVLIVGYG